MKLEILGTRGEIDESAPQHRKHSGILVDDTLLLDVGEKEYLSRNPSQIVITHLHPDHAFFIIDSAEITVPVYGPEPYQGNEVIVQRISDELDLNPFLLHLVPTHHSKKVQSVALVVTRNSSKICYTGDMIWINKEYHSMLKDSDLIITDGSYIRKGGMVQRDKDTGRLYGHNGIPDLIHLFSGLTDLIIFVHFGSWFFKDILASIQKLGELGKENGVEVLAGHDGMILDTKER
jgi:glyoxylase-like metal-dependent hydrolase (beta-lactamase superfamily II)